MSDISANPAKTDVTRQIDFIKFVDTRVEFEYNVYFA